MTLLRASILAAAGMVILGDFIALMNRFDRLRDPDRVGFILNVPTIPSSVRNIECSSGAITDVIITCAFAIDAKDFDELLVGWQFEKSTSGRSTSYMSYPDLGREFDVATTYSAEPESFKHGGGVDLVSNADRTLAVVSRFEE